MTLHSTVETFNILAFSYSSRDKLSYKIIITVIKVYINCLMNPILLGADLAFKGLSILLHCALALSKDSDPIIICLASESSTFLFTANVNMCKKSIKVSLGL